MTDFDRNMRTLVVCFVIAVAAMIPLRLVEVDQERNTITVSSSTVLGQTIENSETIVLPNADIDQSLLK